MLLVGCTAGRAVPPGVVTLPTGTAVCPATGLPGDAAPPARGRLVSTAAQLTASLAVAGPGTVIVLAPGVYQGQFALDRSASAGRGGLLCGVGAVLDGGNLHDGYALHLDHASYWTVRGLTVRDAQKGLVLDASSHDVVAAVTATDVGDEGVHLRSGSSDDTLTGLSVSDAGRTDARFGEGVYIGSAAHNWCRYSGCRPDRCDHDRLLASHLGPGLPAEPVDVKEGTTGGTVSDNVFDGVGTTDVDANAYVDLKGNGWTVTGNVGSGPVRYGVKVHVVAHGWGQDNVVTGNRLAATAYGVYVEPAATGTLVGCDNVVTAAADGRSTVPCGVAVS